MTKRTGVVLSAFVVWAVIGIAHGEQSEDGHYGVAKQFLDCSPKTLKGDQTLTLTLGPGHGSEMAIRRLRGDAWYFLVSRGPSADIKPLMTSEEYASAKTVKIPAATQAYRAQTNHSEERVFSKPGRYIVYSSDNLESEDGGYICIVHYVK